MNEKKLKERGKKYERLEIHFREVDKAVTDDFEYGKLLLLVEKKRINPKVLKFQGRSYI